MSNILQISQRVDELLNEIIGMEQSGVKPPNELIEELESFVDLQADKVDSISGYMSYADSQIDFLRSRIDLIQAEIKRIENSKDRIEYLCKNALEQSSQKSITGKLGSKVYLMESQYVEILDQSKITDEYMRVKTVVEVNKSKIKEDLKSGKKIEGAELKTRKSVVIK